MTQSLRRIHAMFMRYLYLHKRSLPRTLEIIFWPVMELFVWGFVTLYIQSMVESDAAKIFVFLINAMIFWDILYRSQQGVTISFMEEIWHQNIINLLISPLKIWEWVTATFLYGFAKTLVITLVLTFLAGILYHFHLIQAVGFYLIPFMANLLLFGWAVGIVTSGMFVRWGHAAEALIWGVPYLLQPLSAIFYPLSVLPVPIQAISKCIPSTYVFEGMRRVLQTGTLPIDYVLMAFGLNLLYLLAGVLLFQWMFAQAKESGRLVRIGMD